MYLKSLQAMNQIKIPQTFYTSDILIGTHDGEFHCGGILGCYMLKLLFPKATVKRTSDQALLDECDIVLDVGGEYDVSRMRFDHHQPGFRASMSTLMPGRPHTTRLSSAGLVYCHFGLDVLRQLFHKYNVSDVDDQRKLVEVFDRVYVDFVQEIDATENGIDVCTQPRYAVRTSISSRVLSLNKSWNGIVVHNNEYETTFEGVMKCVVGREFEGAVMYAAKVWWPAKDTVKAAIHNRYNADSSGKIIILRRMCPWRDHVLRLEKELDVKTPILYVVSGGNNHFAIHTVPVFEGGFKSRLPLPRSWRGLQHERLRKASGIDGGKFVHPTGFYGTNNSLPGILAMARKSIQLATTLSPDGGAYLSSDSEDDGIYLDYHTDELVDY